eukprot:PhF_6_TR27159/c0_g1_i1/m.39714/K11833/USP2; ubiquitin carboxyl-terminal hydrolase 2
MNQRRTNSMGVSNRSTGGISTIPSYTRAPAPSYNYTPSNYSPYSTTSRTTYNTHNTVSSLPSVPANQPKLYARETRPVETTQFQRHPIIAPAQTTSRLPPQYSTTPPGPTSTRVTPPVSDMQNYPRSVTDDVSSYTPGDSYTSSNTMSTTMDPSYQYSSASSLSTTTRSFRRARGTVGLDNLGNTCFMNATLNCVMRVPQLLSELGQLNLRDQINFEKKTKGAITTSFAALCDKVFVKETGSVSPHEFRSAITSWARTFSNYHQHDAQEFLRFLLDGLHEELNRVRHPPPYQELKDIDGETPRDQAKRWSEYHQARNNSIITDLFGGLLQLDRTCRACGAVSRSFDPFLDLSIPIRKKRSDGIKLEDCLLNFVEKDVLQGSERPYCSKCKKHTDSDMQLSIYRLPRVLVLHLKRFSFRDVLRSKINDKVDFPLESLDMSPYLSTDSIESSSPQSTLYNLVGVINHSGYSGGGHYTAYCCSPHQRSEWFHFNDSHCAHLSPANVVSNAAYLLFYEIVDTC